MMHKKILSIAALFIVSSSAYAGPPITSMSVECNWGKLTMESIQDGFDQGGHSSDPAGDGLGPLSSDQPRVGLANVVEQGSLEALCMLIDDLL